MAKRKLETEADESRHRIFEMKKGKTSSGESPRYREPDLKLSSSDSEPSISITESKDTEEHISSPSSSSSSASEHEEVEEDEEETGTSSDGGDSSSDSEEMIQLPRVGKPSIEPPAPSNLEARLSSFLPAMKRANAELSRGLGASPVGNTRDGGLELESEAEADGAYIEMDLGLGVLEQKMGEQGSSSSSSSSASGDGDVVSGKEDVMVKLMKTKASKPSIEEVEPE